MLEVLKDYLLPYKTEIGTAAAVVAIAQMFACCVVCWNIYKQQCTKNVKSITFVGGIVNGILSLENSYLNNDMRTFVTSIIGITLYSIYTSIYFVYSQNKEEEIYKPLAVAVAVVAVLMVYTQFEDPQLLPWRFGLAVTVLTLAVLGFPLLQIKTIIEKKDASSIQMAVAGSRALVCFLWLLYGFITGFVFMMITNSVGFSLAMAQVMLKTIYPSKTKNKRRLHVN